MARKKKSIEERTISSLIRSAAKSEQHYLDVIHGVFETEDIARISEFFDRLNIPRSQGAEEGLLDPLPEFKPITAKITGWEDERSIQAGMQKYLERHVRKVKWHASHPSLEGLQNVLLVFRGAMVVTDLRLRRLIKLLKESDELTVQQWAIARELMNRSYLTFRNFLNYVAGDWADAIQTAVAPDDLAEALGNFYEYVDETIRKLESHREEIEDLRMELTVLPEGYPPVKPPNYFGGDLMGRGPWKQFWRNIDAKAHKFRETVPA